MNLLPYRILPPSSSYLKLLYISLSRSLVFCLSVSKCLPIDAVRGPPPLPTSPPARQSKRPKKASSRAQAIAEDSQPGPSNSQPSAATPAPRPEGPHTKAARERAALKDNWLSEIYRSFEYDEKDNRMRYGRRFIYSVLLLVGCVWESQCQVFQRFLHTLILYRKRF